MTLINIANLTVQPSVNNSHREAAFSELAFETLFDCFINARMQDLAFWTILQEKFTKWSQKKHVITLWSVRNFRYFIFDIFRNEFI
jgi:hypothetical protein